MAHYHQECYVVLDDYHLLSDDEIHEAMRFFIKHMPDNMTLVDLMIEIGNELLAFDTEETTRFFNQRVTDGVDDSTANSLRDYVEICFSLQSCTFVGLLG